MLKHAFYFFLKLLFLYLTLGVYLVDAVVIQYSMPKVIFIPEPFIHVSSVVIILGALVCLKMRSIIPLLWTIFWVLFVVALMETWWRYLGIFFTIFLFTGAINYLYRNRFTEPTLVFLPIIAGALFLLKPVYFYYLGVWAYYETGIDSFKDDTILQTMIEMGLQTLFVLPFMVMYFLGKHGYIKLIPLWRKLRPTKTELESSVI
jgi:hypothetical protein